MCLDVLSFVVRCLKQCVQFGRLFAQVVGLPTFLHQIDKLSLQRIPLQNHLVKTKFNSSPCGLPAFLFISLKDTRFSNKSTSSSHFQTSVRTGDSLHMLRQEQLIHKSILIADAEQDYASIPIAYAWHVHALY